MTANAQRSLRVRIMGEARSFTASAQNASGHLRVLQKDLAATALAAQRTNAALMGVGRGMARSGRAVAGGMVPATRAVQGFGTAATRNMGAAGAAAGTMAARTTRGTTMMSQGFKDADRHAGAMHGNFENYAGFVGFQMLGRQAMLMGAMVAGAGALAVREFANMEDSFALVRKTVDATEDEYTLLNEQIRELAKVTPIAVTELNEVAAVAGQLGVPTENLLQFTEIMAEMGVASNLTAEQASMAFARIANVMGESLDDEGVGRMTSAVVDLGNNMASQEDEIVAFMQRTAAAANVIGMSSQDLAAFSASMAAVGVKAERGGTAFQRVLFKMMEAVQAAGPELELIAETSGITAEKFAESWREDPALALTTFIEGLESVGEDANAIMSELFGNNVRTTQSFLSLAGAGNLTRDAIIRARNAHEANNARAEEAAERYDTLINKIKVFGNQIRDVAISIGAQLAPFVEKLFEGVAKLATAFGEMPPTLQKVAMVMATVGSGAALVAGSMALMVFPMRVLKGMLPGMIDQWRAYTGTQTLAMRQTANMTAATTTQTAATRANTVAVGSNIAAFRGLNTQMVSANPLWRGLGAAVVTASDAKRVAATSAQSLATGLKNAGRMAGVAMMGLIKIAAPIAALVLAWEGLKWAIDQTNHGFIETEEAADSLAQSLGITLDAVQTFRGEAEEPITMDFKAQNETLITDLQEMDTAMRQIQARRLIIEMELRGASVEEIQSAINKLETAGGITLGVNVEAELGDSEEQVKRLTDDMNRLIESSTAARIPFIQGDTRDSIRETSTLISRLAHDDVDQLVSAFADLRNEAGVMASGTTDAMEGLAIGLGLPEGAAKDLRLELRKTYADLTSQGMESSDVMAVILKRIRDELISTGASSEAIDSITRSIWDLDDNARHAESEFRLLGSAGRQLAEDLASVDDETKEVDNSIDFLAEGFGEASFAADEMNESLLDTIQVMAAGFDPIEKYTELLDEKNEAAKESAKATAEALEDEDASWEDFFTEVEASWSTYVEALDQTLKDQEDWFDNLETIREKAGDAAADYYASLGPEHAGLIADAANQTEEELKKAFAKETEIRDKAASEALERLMRSNQDLVDEQGKLGEGMVAQLAEALDVYPDRITAIMKNGRLAGVAELQGMTGDFETAMQMVVGVMDRHGTDAAAKLQRALEDGGTKSIAILQELGLDSDTALDLLVQSMEDNGIEGTRGLVSALEEGGPQVFDKMEQYGHDADSSLEFLKRVMEESGAEGVERLLRVLNGATSKVEAIASAYATAMERGLNPLKVMMAGMGADKNAGRAAPNIGGGTSGRAELQAEGSVRGNLPNNAVIQSPKSNLVQWAEPETKGEAFIPLAPSKRRRSLAIWAETGKRLGVPMPGEPDATMAEGGFMSPGDVPLAPNYPHNGVDRTGHQHSDAARKAALTMIQEFQELTALGGAGSSGLAATKGLNPKFLSRFKAWSAARGPFSITSGYRSSAQQAVLYARYKAGQGPLAAPPGRSNHEKGLAIDHAPHSWGIARTAGPFGLHHPVSSESWHVEPRAKGGLYNGVQRLDRGGLLRPGTTTVVNNTGKPESVFADGGLRHADPNFTESQFGPGPGSYQLRSFVDERFRHVGDSARAMAFALDEVNGALKEWERQIEAAEFAQQRAAAEEAIAAAREDVKAAEEPEGRKQAKEAEADAIRELIDLDHERRRQQERQRVEDRIAAREEELQRRQMIELNRESWLFDNMSTEDQIANIEDRMKAEERWSDKWMELYNERKKLRDQELQDMESSLQSLESERDTALGEIENLINREQELRDELERNEQEHADNIKRITQERNEGLASAEEDYNNEVKQAREERKRERAKAEADASKSRQDALRQRRDDLMNFAALDEKFQAQWGSSAGAVARNVEAQVQILRESREGVQELRDRGLGADVIEQMGLDDPKNIGQVKMFLRATDQELANLNDVVASRTAQARKTSRHEAEGMYGDLGEALTNIQEQLHGDLDTINEDFQQRRRDAREQMITDQQRLHDEFKEARDKFAEDFKSTQTDLRDELAVLGQDQGMTYGEAIEAGLASGIPAIQNRAQQIQDILRQIEDTKSKISRKERQYNAERDRLQEKAQEEHHRVTTSPLRNLPPELKDAKVYRDPSGAIYMRTRSGEWYEATGPGQIAGIESLYGSARPATHANIGTVRGSVVDLFGGPGEIEKYLTSYDSGGELPPGLTMAYNGTRRAEYVLQSTGNNGRGGGGQQPVIVYHQTILDGKVVEKSVTKEQRTKERNRRVRAGTGGW